MSEPKSELGDVAHTADSPVQPEETPPSILSPLPSGTILITSKATWPLEETQSPYTGWIGVGALVIGALVTALVKYEPKMPFSLADYVWDYRFAVFTGFVLAAMAIYELAWVKVHRRHFDFSAPREMDAAAWSRVVKRCMALYACVAAMTFLYVYLGEYNFWDLESYAKKTDWYYSHFRRLFIAAVPTICVLCWPYFYAVECYGKTGDDDEFLILSRWISKSWNVVCARQPEQRHENAHVANLARGLFVKFFFIPVMVYFCFGNWSTWEYKTHFILARQMDWNSIESVTRNLRNFAQVFYSFILLVDVCNGLVGYIGSCRLLDTQVVSAEPTMFGWVIALLCYPPIQPVLTGVYLEYGRDDIWPVAMFREHPIFSLVMTVASLSLMAIYAWATVAFGLRFSNLTNRGVLCSGPYAYVRHPAYICKNMSWWIEALPAMFGSPYMIPLAIVRMFGTNLIYTMRALTEERHLMREPHYREYCKKVPWRFIPGLW